MSFQNTTILTSNAIRERLTPTNILEEVKGKLDTNEICYAMPSNVQRNAVFLVDIQGKTVKDVAADGLGCFVNDSTFRWNYQHINGEWVCIRPKYKGAIPRDTLAAETSVVVKTYYHHKTCAGFKRIITYVQDNRSQVSNNLVLVGYIFEGEQHPRELLRPHGNSKKQVKGFTRKKPTVIAEVSEKARKTSVVQAVEENLISQGGRATIKDELWVTNSNIYRLNSSKSASKSAEQDFDTIMEWADLNSQFCRTVTSFPEPVIVVASKQQLLDLERFTAG